MSTSIEETLRQMMAGLGKPLRAKPKPSTTAQAHSGKPGVKPYPRPSGPTLPSPVSRYIPEMLVFYSREIKCSCGMSWEIPACARPLLRMRNKYTGTVVETDKKLPTQPLPKLHIKLDPTHVASCQYCLEDFLPEDQGDLFLPPDTVAAMNVLMSIRKEDLQ